MPPSKRLEATWNLTPLDRRLHKHFHANLRTWRQQTHRAEPAWAAPIKEVRQPALPRVPFPRALPSSPGRALDRPSGARVERLLEASPTRDRARLLSPRLRGASSDPLSPETTHSYHRALATQYTVVRTSTGSRTQRPKLEAYARLPLHLFYVADTHDNVTATTAARLYGIRPRDRHELPYTPKRLRNGLIAHLYKRTSILKTARAIDAPAVSFI